MREFVLNFCPACGGPLVLQVPEGDERERHVCSACAKVHYRNPRVVVGALPVWEDKILLCLRAIDPRKGFWTLPAGFMELDESTEDGARRETLEEAGAEIEIRRLLAVYNLTHINQVQLFYTADLRSPQLNPGHESLDARLFTWEEIPWDDLAFPTVRWALDYHRRIRGRDDFPPHTNPGPGRMP